MDNIINNFMFKISSILLLIFVLLILPFKYSFAGYIDGSLDSTFNTTGTGLDSWVWPIAIQNDDKILIAGLFTTYNGTSRNRIARLNSDGSLDTSFDPGTGADNNIFYSYLQQDGKIIIVGSYTTYNGISRNGIARLNSDGSLDTSFDPGTGINLGGTIRFISLTSNGKYYVVGTFTTYNGISRNRIARLNSDGSLDTSFDPGTGADNNIFYSYLQQDGKIIIVGSYTTYNGISRNGIARLNSDGSLDTSFDPGTGINLGGTIRFISLTSNGKYYVVGTFTTYNGISRNRIARLNSDGSLDTSFDPGTGFDNVGWSISFQDDSKILVVGNFTTYNGISRNRIARLNSDGSLDTSFDPGTGANNTIRSIDFQSSGEAIIVGNFTTYNGTYANYIGRLSAIIPSTPITTSDMTSFTDTGSSSTDNLTNDTTPDFTLICATDGNTVTLYTDGVASGTGICASGTVNITSTRILTDDIHTVTYTETSLGGESDQSPSLSITIDTIPPEVSINNVDGDEKLPYNTIDTTPSIVINLSIGDSASIPGYTCITTPATATSVTCTKDTSYNVSTEQTITITTQDEAGNTTLTNVTFDIVKPSSSGSYIKTILNNNLNNNTNITTNNNTLNTNNTYISPLDNTIKSCKPFTIYIKKGLKTNDKNEVKLWQAFLNKYEKENLKIDGIYGNLTEGAMKRFQNKYKEYILTPWNLLKPTGYTYQSTRAYGNKILGCSEGVITLDNGKVINY